MEQKPSVGRIVHYVLGLNADGSPAIAPAIVVSHFGGEHVNLQVFLDGSNHSRPCAFFRSKPEGGFEWADAKLDDSWAKADWICPTPEDCSKGMMWRTSAAFNDTKAPGTWHWPPRV